MSTLRLVKDGEIEHPIARGFVVNGYTVIAVCLSVLLLSALAIEKVSHEVIESAPVPTVQTAPVQAAPPIADERPKKAAPVVAQEAQKAAPVAPSYLDGAWQVENYTDPIAGWKARRLWLLPQEDIARIKAGDFSTHSEMVLSLENGRSDLLFFTNHPPRVNSYNQGVASITFQTKEGPITERFEIGNATVPSDYAAMFNQEEDKDRFAILLRRAKSIEVRIDLANGGEFLKHYAIPPIPKSGASR